jgi:universal stress protein E
VLELDRIVVGVDFRAEDGRPSRGSRAAVDATLALAPSGARIALVHSSAGEVYWHPIDGRIPLVSEGMSATARASLDGLVRELRGRGLRAEAAVDDEKPHLALLRRARDERAGLVVVGKHEEDESGRKMGNVARKVVHMSACPTLVVRPPAPKQVRRVLAATDLSPVGKRALLAAAEIVETFGAAFDVVHAFPFPFQEQFPVEASEPGGHEKRVRELAAQARAALERACAEAPAGGRAEIHVANGPAERVIEAAVERFGPDLLVLGTVSRGGIAGLLVGNTAERLLERVACSILAVKPEDFVSPV